MRVLARAVSAGILSAAVAAALAGCAHGSTQAAALERTLEGVVGSHGTAAVRADHSIANGWSCRLAVTLDAMPSDELLVELLTTLDEEVPDTAISECLHPDILVSREPGEPEGGYAFLLRRDQVAPRAEAEWLALAEYVRTAAPSVISLDVAGDPQDAHILFDADGASSVRALADAAEAANTVPFPDAWSTADVDVATGETDWSRDGLSVTQTRGQDDRRREVLDALALIEESMAGDGSLAGRVHVDADGVSATIEIIDHEWYTSVSPAEVEENDLIPGSLAERTALAISGYFEAQVPHYNLHVFTTGNGILDAER